MIGAKAEINRQNNLGETALMIAAEAGYEETVQVLLTAGASIDLKDNFGNTALIHAVFKHKTKVVDVLLRAGANTDISNKWKETALGLAKSKRYDDIVQAFQRARVGIIKRTAVLSFETDDWNDAIVNVCYSSLLENTPAIVSGHMLKKLIEKYVDVGRFFESRQWTLFAHASDGLYVIIPENIKDKAALNSEYGFKAVEGPISDPTTLSIKFEETGKMIHGLEEIIDISKNHVRQFFLIGHGGERVIANVKNELLGKLLSTLANLKTKFLYVDTCNVAGQNLLEIQKNLQEIIAQKSKENLKVNYIIVLQATTDVPTSGAPLFATFFKKLETIFNEKEDISYHEEKQIQEIVRQSVSHEESSALPSIRLPGATTFFRAIDLGNTEVITWTKLQTMRASNAFKLTTIPIKNGVQFIQIYPFNLMDCIFDIKATEVPKFISKIPGDAQHFIGGIKYASSKNDLTQAIDKLLKDGFIEVFPTYTDPSIQSKPLTNKCWFIKTVELTLPGNVKRNVDDLAINLNQSEYLYHDSSGYHKTGGELITEQKFRDLITAYFEASESPKMLGMKPQGGMEYTKR